MAITKTIDLTKFRRNLTGKLDIPVGFSDPKIWIDTGNFALNRLISGNYNNGVPLSKVTMFAGETGAGKSLLAANVMKNAQAKYNTFIVLLDSEGAGDKKWYKDAGVDISEDKFMRIPVFTVGTCTKVVSELIKEMKDQGSDQPILIVIDSLGMLETDTGQEKFLAGKSPGDQGQLAKQLKKFIKNCLYLVEQKDIGFLVTNHTYDSQDMFNPDQKITGGAGILYASSIVIAAKKYKLKEVSEDQETTTMTGVHGVRTTVMVYKSRFNKPFEKTTVNIPWEQGIDRYSGLIEMFENDGLLTKTGNRLAYTDKSGKEYIHFKKRLPNELLDTIMEEHPYELTRDSLKEIAERETALKNEEVLDE